MIKLLSYIILAGNTGVYWYLCGLSVLACGRKKCQGLLLKKRCSYKI